ncbi:type VI secretion system baseplate subunit TssE [Litoribacillus peritrichatus]|uniref:Type VI secretion system baseplate subunit TssE n=1 Tax=Litoribacillus peritrichatus TaxID=718191 RepID=A0ABP7MDQ6_9GAMM
MDKKQPLQMSILDRLIDESPGFSDSPRARRGADIKKLRQSVRRDLENLLNSKVQWHVWPEAYSELDLSLLNYGLPDFSSMAMDSLDGRQALCYRIEQTIRQFEPRFIDVDVTLLDEEQPLDRILKIRIDALLYADPIPEPITFDSEIEPVHLGLKVRDSLI